MPTQSVVLAVVRQMRGAARHARLEQGAVSREQVVAAAKIVTGRKPDDRLADDEAWKIMCELTFGE